MPVKTKNERGEFVAWDGEGLTVNGRHTYVYCANSAGDRLGSLKGLRSARLLRFLCDALERNKRAINVGFAFSYDSNMILAHLNRRQVNQLWTTGETMYRGYRIRYRPRKELSVHRRQGERWVGGTIWDAFGFFQSSFVAALAAYDVGWDWERREIEKMKHKRAVFSRKDWRELKAYCDRECKLLAAMMEKLWRYTNDAGLQLRRWDGAGAVASALLQREGVAEHLGPDPARPSARWPERIRDASQFAYFGGRIELLKFGHHPGRVWQYDVRSAYPSALARLPSFAPGAGRWIDGEAWWLYPFSVALVSWDLSSWNRVYPFPWRAKDGAVLFPPKGRSWVWGPELLVAHRAMKAGQLSGRLNILEAWSWAPSTDVKPYAFVPALYRLRAQWKKEGRGAEKVLKLGLNSLYGKMAQQLGGDRSSAPRFHMMEGAGWVTSFTRAMVTQAALAAGEDAVMIATDAIYTTRPLTLGGSELGQWDASEHETGTFAQAGVYWCGSGEKEGHHFRGFNPESLDRSRIIKAWANGAHQVGARTRRFVTMGAALAGDESWKRWRTWEDQARTLTICPLPHFGQKRFIESLAGVDPSRFFVATDARQPYHAESWDGVGTSCPVVLPWRDLEGIGGREIDEYNRILTEMEDAEL